MVSAFPALMTGRQVRSGGGMHAHDTMQETTVITSRRFESNDYGR